MKTRAYWKLGLALSLAILPLAGGCVQQASSLSENRVAMIDSEAGSDAAVQTPGDAESVAADENLAATVESPQSNVSDAAVIPISTQKPLPATLHPSGPLAEVLKLADSGVDENVLLAFITNSESTFNLNADEIIYLNDLGISSKVIGAIMQRDR